MEESVFPDAGTQVGPVAWRMRSVTTTSAEPNLLTLRSTYVRDTPPVNAAHDPAYGEAGSDADLAITAMYHAEYRSLVRTSALLVGDESTAEEVVQDSFIAVHGIWRRLRHLDKALPYLRQSVLSRSRSVLRGRKAADRYLPRPEPDLPSAEQGAIALIERSKVIAALRALPARQREALVLRFYLDMSEEQVASAMKISRGAVKCHTARGKAALRHVLDRQI